ncbi:hypothetical protein PG990_001024 [Apiospora arundinis]|uniref:Uncharacterized protein n=1 Tax=Apiospora arundinis TaxID=335852 RepID=A0ABR2I1Y2_9PEZI
MDYYTGSEMYDDGWQGNAGMDDGNYATYPDIEPDITFGDVCVDPAALTIFPDSANVYPPATTDGYGEQDGVATL